MAGLIVCFWRKDRPIASLAAAFLVGCFTVPMFAHIVRYPLVRTDVLSIRLKTQEQSRCVIEGIDAQGNAHRLTYQDFYPSGVRSQWVFQGQFLTSAPRCQTLWELYRRRHAEDPDRFRALEFYMEIYRWGPRGPERIGRSLLARFSEERLL